MVWTTDSTQGFDLQRAFKTVWISANLIRPPYEATASQALNSFAFAHRVQAIRNLPFVAIKAPMVGSGETSDGM
ncbi:MAG: hypothetical protein WA840_20220 [Caulobacteraceae bacterium]